MKIDIFKDFIKSVVVGLHNYIIRWAI